jgi:cytochrome P450
MSGVGGARLLDRERVRELFDLRSGSFAFTGGGFEGDPYPAWARLRASGPVHEGTVHGLTEGFEGDAFFHGLTEPNDHHFSAFSFAACDQAYRSEAVFASSPDATQPDLGHIGALNSMLTMGGARHRRYRGLVQPSFVPAKARWWIANWIDRTVNALIDNIVEEGHAELNIDFCAAIPVLTITGSFGIPVERALEIRAELFNNPNAVAEAVAPIISARRDEPQDDLISVLVQAELEDDDGRTQRLSDDEINSFTVLLLTAGSGTTWKQMGITLAALLQRPEALDALRADRSRLKNAVEESVRWQATDPMFSRWVTEDVELEGTHLPRGSVLHLCLGAANRDPARWDDPDEYDLTRPIKPSLGFGGGPHVCLGMHVARAEMVTGIGALLDRLPHLRLDPEHEPPRFIGLYERGANEIHVTFDRS